MADELTTVDALAQLSFLLQGTLERRAGERDISLVQTRLLGILRDRTPTMSELAELLELDKSSASGLVDRAQKRGLVRRVPSQLDRRSVRIRLTPEGRGLVQEVSADFSDDVTAMLEPLTPELRQQLTSTLNRVLVAHAAAQGVDLFPTGSP
jgi:DNA-binding MarR family transcriptional regulator